MKCPIDQVTLAMMERQGIEIDYCPTCRGVWLDRGELDKLIAAQESSTASAQRAYNDAAPRNDRPVHKDENHYYKKHKRDSFLGDLFDF